MLNVRLIAPREKNRMVEVLRTDKEGEYRYRITETEKGFLVTMRTSKGAGKWPASEWLHHTPEAADACLDAVKALNAAWQAMAAGLPSEALLRKAEVSSAAHTQLCKQFQDHPLVGQEVKELWKPEPDDAVCP
jgi:hypothetical protein